MKKLILLTITLFSMAGFAEQKEYFVKLNSDVDQSQFRAFKASLSSNNIALKRQFEIVPGLFLVSSEKLKLDKFLSEMSFTGAVEYAHENFKRRISVVDPEKYEPNLKPDPGFQPKTHALRTEWKTDPKEHANFGTHQSNTFKVWKDFGLIGDKKTVIAIIDTGVDYTHDDLKDNMWVNPGESGDGKETNGIDDDGNGFIDDVYGYDFVNKDADPYDDHYHGTHVAGIAAATGGNGIGSVGHCPRCSIMALKFISSDGYGSDADAILSLEYALNNGASVINSSWGSEEFSQALYDAFKATSDAGIFNAVAAGNSGENISGKKFYPANHNLPGQVTTAALREVNLKYLVPFWSNYSKQFVHLSMAGERVYSTWPENTYRSISGTSMASPGIAGVAGLIRSHFPDLSNTEIYDVMTNPDHILYDAQSMAKVKHRGRPNTKKIFQYLLGK